MKKTFISLAAVFGFTVSAFAETVDLSTITGNTIFYDGTVITGTLDGQTKPYRLAIAADATVTLSNAVINGVNSDSCKWAGLNCHGSATIVLVGNNTVVGFHRDYPGIHVPWGSTLTNTVIGAAGTLSASSNGGGAGIGGGFNVNCGNIVVDGGAVITATGGDAAPGIGCGYDSSCGDISIVYGSVTANGGNNAAGIGSGNHYSSCGNISILYGNVVAHGGLFAVGIGAGCISGCGNIVIDGGSITASGGQYAVGIGSSYSSSSCGDITITGGDVHSIGGRCAPGIGSGCNNSYCCNIKVDLGTIRVVANRGERYSYDEYPLAENVIGAGPSSSIHGNVDVNHTFFIDKTANDGNTRTIQWNGDLSPLPNAKEMDYYIKTCNMVAFDGTVITGTLRDYFYKVSIADKATVTLSNAVIRIPPSEPADALPINSAPVTRTIHDWAGVTCEGDATIVIAGTNTVVAFGEYKPGIHVPDGKTITISDKSTGSLDVRGTSECAGIGGGGHNRPLACGNIVINGGVITATGGYAAAAIGGGKSAKCGNITIHGGIITANGGDYAAAIGGGYRGTNGTINIDGGYVKAVYYSSSGAIPIGKGLGPAASSGAFTMGSGMVSNDVAPNCIVKWNGDLSVAPEYAIAANGTEIHGSLTEASKVSIMDDATVTLSNVTINATGAWAGINCLGSATIVLEDDNTVEGNGKYPGIHVPGGYALTIQGDGSLNAVGHDDGAGIGGGAGLHCGDITINGGTISANGGRYGAAGIGSGRGFSNNGIVEGSACGTITIAGGNVTVAGGNWAAGIGCGDLKGYCAGINITGGTVYATGGGEHAGAGIGCADESTCGSITIGSGITRVVATAGGAAEPIGGVGSRSVCGTVIVSGRLTDDNGSPTRTITGNGGGGVDDYSTWMEEYGAGSGLSGAWDDKDSNGVANVFHYIFDTPGDFTDPLIEIVFDDGMVVVKTLPVLSNIVGFNVTIEATDDLNGSWVEVVSSLSADGINTIGPMSDTYHFYRIKVVQAP